MVLLLNRIHTRVCSCVLLVACYSPSWCCFMAVDDLWSPYSNAGPSLSRYHKLLYFALSLFQFLFLRPPRETITNGVFMRARFFPFFFYIWRRQRRRKIKKWPFYMKKNSFFFSCVCHSKCRHKSKYYWSNVHHVGNVACDSNKSWFNFIFVQTLFFFLEEKGLKIKK